MPIPQEVNDRIDAVLAANRQHELPIIMMAVGIFVLGAAALAYGMVQGNVYVVAPATLIDAALYWPINELKKMRKENIALAAIPSLISTLPPEEAARELVKLLEKLTK